MSASNLGNRPAFEDPRRSADSRLRDAGPDATLSGATLHGAAHRRRGVARWRPGMVHLPPGGRLSSARARLFAAAVILGLLAPALVPATALAGTAATDGPGSLSHFDLARKDCLGTAQNTTSKVWFTVAGGVLSDVYYPTIDNTNVETLQYVVTDGSTFTDLQTRDMTYTVSSLGPSGMSCRVTSTAKSGRYKLVTDYITDPHRNSVLMRTFLIPLTPGALHLYVRFDPTVNGNGGGGSGNGGADSATVDTSTGHNIAVSYDTVTATQAANNNYRQPVFAALDGPLGQVESGFAGGASDGLTQLDASHALTASTTDALNGNVVQTAALVPGYVFNLALGFGSTQAGAVATAEGSLHTPFDLALFSYEAGWANYDAHLDSPPHSIPGLTFSQTRAADSLYYTSANVVKASEDKTFPGAISASMASPWGQATSAGDPANTYFGSYREIFARDLYEAWTGLMADGDLTTARDAVNFLFLHQQQTDGSMPRNSLLNGKTAPDSFGTQLDEAAYPILMADDMHMFSSSLYTNHVKPAALFLISHGPSFGVERWEEQGGYSPSTIAAEIAGLVAAADIANHNGDGASAKLFLGVADDYQRSIKGWTVTTTGPLSPSPYFIRLSKTGDPNAAISYNVGNGGPTLDQRAVMDAGFLELVRLGELPANDPQVAASIPVLDAAIESPTASGPGWHRYNGDGYGDHSGTGAPWAPSGQGTGHLWPALSVERGEYDLVSGGAPSAVSLVPSFTGFASGVGLLPEQVWELPNLAASPYGTDPTLASFGFVNGQAAGSAAPLTWSSGSYVRLIADLKAHRLLDTPAVTTARYVTHTQGQTPISITSPANLTAVVGPTLTVTGTSTAGNKIVVAATDTDQNSATTTATTTAALDGSWSVSLTIQGGTSVINAVATSPNGATGHAEVSVVWDFTPGTVVFSQTDPSNDDNGPGNYAYPTSSNFQPGAYDITNFQVIVSPDGLTTTFKLQTRDLTPTFGSPLGAQLADVYVHDPAAVTTSTAASFPQRNYQIAAGSAWSRLLEVQGFGQRYIDATGATVGTIAISANQISRYITFSVPTASLGGTPASGWGFTVVLTGQDGFSPDQARGFQTTPQDFQFGVCATASSDPHCTFAPGSVPKAMDVLTPAGVLQSDELDYTLHSPVVIQDVTIP
jgi:glucoamylase